MVSRRVCLPVCGLLWEAKGWRWKRKRMKGKMIKEWEARRGHVDSKEGSKCYIKKARKMRLESIWCFVGWLVGLRVD